MSEKCAELRRSLHYSGHPNFSVRRDTLKALLDAADLLDDVRDHVRRGALCPMCSTGMTRQTVGLICQLCGTDYDKESTR